MGDITYGCPLCCSETFNSKQELTDHLSNILQNLQCPICGIKESSVVQLVEHLSLDNCQPDNSDDLAFEDINKLDKRDENGTTKIMFEISQNGLQNSDETLEAVATTDVNKMYVDLLDKQLMKPGLDTQDLKLIKADGGNRYMIVTSDDADLTFGNTIVTKQNNDGTISFTSIADMKLEPQSEKVTVNPLESEEVGEPEESQEEIYSCNTCGVSFTSVLEHIQNYHGDQEVVVEEPLEQHEESDSEAPQMEYDSLMEENTETEETPSDKQPPRRVLTDTGDIVEAPMSVKLERNVEKEDSSAKVVTKDKQVITKRYIQVNELNLKDNFKEIKSVEEKGGPYHKVIVKEAQTEQGTTVKLLNCLTCNRYVSSLSEFKSYPCKALKYTCPHCPVSYENSKSLCAHMKVHKVKSDATFAPISYECETCNTMFPTNKSLKLHKRMHDPIKSRPIQPPVASTEGPDAIVKQYQCNVCEKLIPVEYKTIHQNSHKSSDKMNCSVCNKKFTSLEYLEMHMNVHNLDKAPKNNQDKLLPYNCLFCNRRFARPHEKVKHERIHTGEKPHACEICGKSFRVSYCLTLHMRTHTGARPYACPHCPKRFKAHSVYNHHLLTHSDVRAYKCPFCPKAFKTAVQLAGHKNSHTKPFSCQQCNRPFASLYAVRIHTETHARQNNLKFSCSLCGASYARAFALKDHVKQVHKHELDTDNITRQEEEWMPKDKSDGTKVLDPAKDLSEEVFGF